MNAFTDDVLSAAARPAVTIITRTKDRTLLLERAFQSVLSQSFSDWIHVIVNDGGDAEEVNRITASYLPKYKGRLRVIHNPESLTMESASNRGLSIAESEYFCIHDDDDSWEPEFLADMVTCLDSHGQDKGIGGAVCFANVIMEDVVDGNVVERSRHFFSDYDGMSFFTMMGRNWFPPICFLTRTAVLEKIGMFDGRLPVLGDWDFNMRLMRHFNVVVYRKPLANYHHRNSADGALSNSVYAENDKHRSYKSLLIDRELRRALDEQKIDLSLVAMFAMMNQKLVDLQDELKQMKHDVAWEIRNHIDWKLDGKP